MVQAWYCTTGGTMLHVMYWSIRYWSTRKRWFKGSKYFYQVLEYSCTGPLSVAKVLSTTVVYISVGFIRLLYWSTPVVWKQEEERGIILTY
jgi:hypothetical protein